MSEVDLSRNQLTLAEILEITLTNGVKGWLTSCSEPVVYAGDTYLPVPPGSADGWHDPITYPGGLQVPKVTFTIGIVSVTVGGVKTYTIPQIIRRGFLRGAWCKLSLVDWSDLAVPARPLFEGPISEDISYNAGTLTFAVSSILDLLDRTVPQIVYSEFCQRHSTRADADTYLFGRDCGLPKADYLHADACGDGTTAFVIYAPVFAFSNHAQGYWVKGEFMMTSGDDEDVRRSIREHGDGWVNLVIRLPEAPAIGDTFNVYPGCDKLRATCDARFNNTANCYDAPDVPKQQDLVF